MTFLNTSVYFTLANLFVCLFIWVLGKQQLLAVGDSMGTLHVMEVPWNLRHPSANEVNSLYWFPHTVFNYSWGKISSLFDITFHINSIGTLFSQFFTLLPFYFVLSTAWNDTLRCERGGSGDVFVTTSKNEFFYLFIFDGLKWLCKALQRKSTGTILSGLTRKPKIKGVILQSRYCVATVTPQKCTMSL